MITFEKVTKRYRERKVIDGMNLEIPEGKTVTLVGPSGCGKTTMLKMINRLVRPTEGVIRIKGEDISNLDMIGLRRKMGYVIQQTGLFPHMTVRENITIIPRLENSPPDEVERKLGELFEMTGLDPALSHRFPSQLSGGQQQRVGVARAFANDPEIILMDEPFSALDPITKGQLQDELINIQNNLHKTIVFVTHDMNEAVKVGDMICIMKEGRVLQYDTPENILKNPADGFVTEFVGKNRIWNSPELIKAGDIMINDPVVCYPYTTLLRCQEKMRENHVDAVFVVNRAGELLGFTTARKIRGQANLNIPVSDIMKTDMITVEPADSMPDVLKLVNTQNISRVPVTENGRLKGLITPASLISALSQQYIDEDDGGRQ